MNKYKDILIPTIVMLCICIVITGALAGANILTNKKIAENKEQSEILAKKEVLSADTYESKTAKQDGDEISYDVAKNGDETIGYIFVTSEKGYGGGNVEVMTAITTDGKVKAVKILDVSSQTPGLGQNTAKEKFYTQFAELDGTKEISVLKNGASKEDNTINAVTAATISSKAVTSAVNKATAYYKTISNESGDK